MCMSHALCLIILVISASASLWFNNTAIGNGNYPRRYFRQTNAYTRRSRELSGSLESPKSTCRVNLQDVQCLTPFENLAQHKTVIATSTCGQHKIQRLCRTDGQCQICDRNSAKWNFSTDRLTDIHVNENQTCWASSLVHSGGLDKAVNLTLSLGKRFEVYFVSLMPCVSGSLPDSIAIFKSSDFGRTWRPWHYFSTDCYRAFGMPTTNVRNSQINSANLQEVLCIALQPRETYHKIKRTLFSSDPQNQSFRSDPHPPFEHSEAPPDWVITFSTTLGRPSTRPWSPALIDWMTATDVRISLMRFPSISTNTDYRIKRTIWGSSNPGLSYYPSLQRLRTGIGLQHTPQRVPWSIPRDRRSSANEFKIPLKTNSSIPNRKSELSLPDFATIEPEVLSESEFYALADLTIGGRCKCNGHASECRMDRDGQLRCVCEHNTEGDDCERCKPGYMDRPWERATNENANACTKCDCNLHSDECRFSNSLYLMMNRMSGGVCENCQHHTAGRSCQHCAEGYHRDWTKPVSHENVCLPCRCHPFGSIVQQDCDRRSGQCRCKQGVTGLTCNRCQDGYHQTRSPVSPCTKDFTPHAVAMAHTPIDIQCPDCSTNKELIRLKRFCKTDAVFHAYMKSRELHGSMVRFEMEVIYTWRLNRKTLKTSRAIHWPLGSRVVSNDRNLEMGNTEIDESVDGKLIPVWVRWSDLRCKCPDIQLGISYLILTDFETHNHKGILELKFTTKTAVLPWRSIWNRRLMRFKRRENRGGCEKFRDANKLTRHDHSMRPGMWNYSWRYPASHRWPATSNQKPNYMSPPMVDRQYRRSQWGYRNMRRVP